MNTSFVLRDRMSNFPKQTLKLDPDLNCSGLTQCIEVDLYAPLSEQQWDIDEYEEKSRFILFLPTKAAWKEAYREARLILRSHSLTPDYKDHTHV